MIFGIEADTSDFEADLERAEKSAEDAGKAMNEATEVKIGGALGQIGELTAQLGKVELGAKGAAAAMQAMNGDISGAVKAAEGLPMGLGTAIQGMNFAAVQGMQFDFIRNSEFMAGKAGDIWAKEFRNQFKEMGKAIDDAYAALDLSALENTIRTANQEFAETEKKLKDIGDKAGFSDNKIANMVDNARELRDLKIETAKAAIEAAEAAKAEAEALKISTIQSKAAQSLRVKQLAAGGGGLSMSAFNQDELSKLKSLDIGVPMNLSAESMAKVAKELQEWTAKGGLGGALKDETRFDLNKIFRDDRKAKEEAEKAKQLDKQSTEATTRSFAFGQLGGEMQKEDKQIEGNTRKTAMTVEQIAGVLKGVPASIAREIQMQAVFTPVYQ